MRLLRHDASHCILLLWGIFIESGILELISGFIPGIWCEALIPQGLTGRPDYFGLLNNLMTLIICESLREISETTCVTSAWSSRGQTLNSDFLRMSRIGRHSRKIDFSFISPKHTFGWTYSRESSLKIQRFILRPKFKKVRNWHIMAFSRLKIFKIPRFFMKTAGA